MSSRCQTRSFAPSVANTDSQAGGHGDFSAQLELADAGEPEVAKNLSVKFTKTRIPYRETIRKSVQSSYRHKKQSGGAGQFGERLDCAR